MESKNSKNQIQNSMLNPVNSLVQNEKSTVQTTTCHHGSISNLNWHLLLTFTFFNLWSVLGHKTKRDIHHFLSQKFYMVVKYQMSFLMICFITNESSMSFCKSSFATDVSQALPFIWPRKVFAKIRFFVKGFFFRNLVFCFQNCSDLLWEK